MTRWFPPFARISLGPSATWRTHGTRSHVGTIYRVSKVGGVCKVGSFSEALKVLMRGFVHLWRWRIVAQKVQDANSINIRFGRGHACEVDAECCGSCCVNGQCAGEFSLFS
eukprot:scaffold1598_cov139-Skeletonema_marinoi.AAC.4